MKKEIELDLEKDILEGWEPFYDFLNVEVLKIARAQGHILPPVEVVKEKGIYRLVFGRDPDNWKNYGGHSRSIAALQNKLSLYCIIQPSHRENPENPPLDSPYHSGKLKYIPIQKMQQKRKTNMDSMCRLEENLRFLPDEIKEKFIEENSLVILENGHLIDKEDYLNPPPF